MEVIGNPYEILRNPFSWIPIYLLRIHWKSLGIQLESSGTPKESLGITRYVLGIRWISLGNPKEFLGIPVYILGIL